MIRSISMASTVLVALCLSLCACSKEADAKKTTTGSTAARSASAVPDTYWLASPPAGAKPAGEVRKNAKTGDAVVVNGIVGGRKEPFIDGAAAFTIVSDSVKKCTEGECESPWDFCCEPPDSLKANMVVVEIRDGKAPLKTTARGFHGLDGMKNVTVTGVAERDDAGNVIVVAKGIHVAP